VARLGQSRRRRDVVVSAERHDQDVRLIGVQVGRDPQSLGVDRRDRLLAEPDSRRFQVRVRQSNLLFDLPAEHQLELGEPEDERVAAVDQGDVDGIAELGR